MKDFFRWIIHSKGVLGLVITVCLLMSLMYANLFYTLKNTTVETSIGTLQSVDIGVDKATIVLDSGNVTFWLGNDLLQVPLEIGCRYQIDTKKTISFFGAKTDYILRSVTKLP
jgi:hypothetical protein